MGREKKLFSLSRVEKEQEKLKSAIYSLIKICEEKDLRKIGITTTSVNDRNIPVLCERMNEKAKEMSRDIKFVNIDPILYSSVALEKVKEECDAVTLVERYAYTPYRDIEKVKQMLNREEILLLGVIAYR